MILSLNNRLLEGKTSMITGANRGIGKEISELFAYHGSNLILSSRKKTQQFEQFAEDLKRKYKIQVFLLHFDLSDEISIKLNIKQILEEKIQVNVLINNAAISHGGFLHMTPISRIKEVFEVNFFSQILITQTISKIMKKNKNGSIINISSIAGIDSLPGYIAYGSSKAALIYATKTLSKEFADYGIRINSVAPGLTETNMASEMEEKAKEYLINQSAFKRQANPSEIANAVLFLASDLSSFVNGQVLRVDGGI